MSSTNILYVYLLAFSKMLIKHEVLIVEGLNSHSKDDNLGYSSREVSIE